ncbi:hypothetical protein OWR21_02415 [Ralstonia sp. 1B3]
MQGWAALLQAIAAILWPVFAFTALFVFRAQIADLAKRLKKGKLLGQEIELSDSLDKLTLAVESAQSEVASLPNAVIPEKTLGEQAVQQDIVRRIIDEAGRSPKAALIMLASELEKVARQTLAITGHLNGRRFVPMREAIEQLHKAYGLPTHVPSSLKHFWEIRNRLIHGGEGNDEDILRAIDSGISILKALQALPSEINVVHDPGVTVYLDAGATTPIEGVKGVILETHSPGGVSKSFRIFPTRNIFIKGKEVSWEWNMGLVISNSWYKDPVSGEIRKAWESAAEFVGRHLDEI